MLKILLTIAVANASFIVWPVAVNATPCQGVDRQLTNEEKTSFSPAIAAQLNGSSVVMLGAFKYGGWSVYFVEPQPEYPSDEPYLFYSGNPLNNHYVADWSGAAASFEQNDIEKWVIQNAKGIPMRLAKCFAWHVTNDPDK